MGLLVAIVFQAGVPRQFPTQGGVGPPHAFRIFPKGFVLLLHRVQMVAFGLGQLSSTPFHLGTPSFGRPEKIPVGRPLRWCTYYVNSRVFE